MREQRSSGDRSADPGEAGAGQEPRAASPVPLRREARHHEVPAGQGAASGQAPEARAVLPRQGEGLRALPAQGRLPVQAEPVQDDCPALLRGRRRTLRRSEEDRQLYRRHFWRSEGFRGETKTQHGLRRAVRRSLGNMKIQSCPTAAAINLKRLAAAFHARFPASGMIRMREMLVSAVPARWTGRIRQIRTGFA